MLTYIYVNGFRSLSDFSMEIRPSLNILIGPNGGGKSNIIGFFQFLSRLMRTNLSDAVSLTGGAGAFFQKTGETAFENEVNATVRGLAYIDDRDVFSDSGWAQYEYKFVVRASERFDSIIFSQQKVSIRGLSRPKSPFPLNVDQPRDDEWDLIIESCADPATLKICRRARTVQQTVYLPPAVHEQLRELAFEERVKMHTLLMEGLDLVFKARDMLVLLTHTPPRGSVCL